VDSHGLMLAYEADLEAHGGAVVLNTPVLSGIVQTNCILLRVPDMSLRARTVVNAAGLSAQTVSRALDGVAPHTIPDLFLAKGHYFTLSGRSPFNRLVYPIADNAGLGIHVTLDMSGAARFGPDVLWTDAVDYGFDVSRRAAFSEAIRLYYPELDESRLQPAYTGIRPKITGKNQKAADFCVRGPQEHGGAPYVALYGIESPGLTASLALASHVIQCLAHQLTSSNEHIQSRVASV
jgi:L-2-hydroxyglutarate oxidase LhgO